METGLKRASGLLPRQSNGDRFEQAALARPVVASEDRPAGKGSIGTGKIKLKVCKTSNVRQLNALQIHVYTCALARFS